MKNSAFLEMLKEFGLLRTDLQPSAMDAMKKLADEVEDDEGAEDETPEEKEAREKKESGKAEDEDKISASDHTAAVAKAAIDARATVLADVQAAAEAKDLVKNVLVWEGALDSAPTILKAALEKSGVAFDGITETAGLKALFLAHQPKAGPVKTPVASKGLDLATAFPHVKIRR